jgi:hypothetical protein
VAAGLEAGVPYLVNKELICRADAWRERVAEILAAPRGRGLVRPLELPPERPGAAAPFPSALLDVLRHPTLRGLAPPVFRALLRRALWQGFGVGATEMEKLEDWLVGVRMGQGPGVPLEVDTGSVLLLTKCLAEQLECLLGSSASAAVRAALDAVIANLVPKPTR